MIYEKANGRCKCPKPFQISDLSIENWPEIGFVQISSSYSGISFFQFSDLSMGKLMHAGNLGLGANVPCLSLISDISYVIDFRKRSQHQKMVRNVPNLSTVTVRFKCVISFVRFKSQHQNLVA